MPTARRDAGPATPASNRERILALEAEVTQLREIAEPPQRDIQRKRIAQLQVDLEAIRAAWVKAGARARRH
jgi:hypothetical protein